MWTTNERTIVRYTLVAVATTYKRGALTLRLSLAWGRKLLSKDWARPTLD